jgi:hypothetical protein
LRNFEGMLVSYPEPQAAPAPPAASPDAATVKGVWSLANGTSSKLVPTDTARIRRRSRKTACAPVADVAL